MMIDSTTRIFLQHINRSSIDSICIISSYHHNVLHLYEVDFDIRSMSKRSISGGRFGH